MHWHHLPNRLMGPKAPISTENQKYTPRFPWVASTGKKNICSKPFIACLLNSTYAASHKRSLSGLIESFLKSLIIQEDSSYHEEDIQILPFVKSMASGVNIPADLDYKAEYSKYLEEKHKWKSGCFLIQIICWICWEKEFHFIIQLLKLLHLPTKDKLLWLCSIKQKDFDLSITFVHCTLSYQYNQT